MVRASLRGQMRTTSTHTHPDDAHLALTETPGTLGGSVVPSLSAQLDAYEDERVEPAEEVDPVTEQRVLLLAAVVAGLVAASVLGLLMAAALSVV